MIALDLADSETEKYDSKCLEIEHITEKQFSRNLTTAANRF